jgi:hypothetical protein
MRFNRAKKLVSDVNRLQGIARFPVMSFSFEVLDFRYLKIKVLRFLRIRILDFQAIQVFKVSRFQGSGDSRNQGFEVSRNQGLRSMWFLGLKESRV